MQKVIQIYPLKVEEGICIWCEDGKWFGEDIFLGVRNEGDDTKNLIEKMLQDIQNLPVSVVKQAQLPHWEQIKKSI